MSFLGPTATGTDRVDPSGSKIRVITRIGI